MKTEEEIVKKIRELRDQLNLMIEANLAVTSEYKNVLALHTTLSWVLRDE